MTETDNAELAGAIRAGCTAADVHLTCSYPSCTCKQIPAAVEAALRRPAPWVSEEPSTLAGDPVEMALTRAYDEVKRVHDECAAKAHEREAMPKVKWRLPATHYLDQAIGLSHALDLIHNLRPSHGGPNSLGRGQPAPRDRFHNPQPGDRYCVEDHSEPAPAEAQEPIRPTTQEMIDRIERDYDFSCEAGPLINCVDWQKMKERLLAQEPPQPTVTPDTAGARDFAKFLDGDEFTAPLRTALTEVRVWAEAAAAKSANHITTLASQVEKLTAEKVTAAQSWQCFHCDRIFTDRTSAEEHFGTRQYDAPLCVADQFELTSTRKERDEYAAIRVTLLAELAKAREGLEKIAGIDEKELDVIPLDRAFRLLREQAAFARNALTGAKP